MRNSEIRRCFIFPPHLSSASALPCEIGNPEDSALVHCACNTVKLLQRSSDLVREMSTSQSAVMLCGWGVKAGWLIPLVDKRVGDR